MSRSSTKMLQHQGRLRGQCVPGEAYFDKRHSLHCEECRQTHPRNEDNLTPKEADLIQTLQTIYPKKEDNLTQKLKMTSHKNQVDPTKEIRQPCITLAQLSSKRHFLLNISLKRKTIIELNRKTKKRPVFDKK